MWQCNEKVHFTSVAIMEASPLDAPLRLKWQSDADASARRFVLFHVLMVLKTKYGAIDARISGIARRAELALYSRAHSMDEYRNPRTLCKRLHALIIKLYAQQSEVSKKRKAPTSPTSSLVKRHRATSSFLLDGHDGALRMICTFLDTQSVMALAATNRAAQVTVPQHVTSLLLHAARLPTSPRWLHQFPNLADFRLSGANRFGFGDVVMDDMDMSSNNAVEWALTGLETMTYPHLCTLELSRVYCDGLHDPITHRIAQLVERSPSLQSVALQGNCISDAGAMALADRATHRRGLMLDLDHNFIGERGAAALAAVTATVSLQNNLMEPTAFQRLMLSPDAQYKSTTALLPPVA
ncbi:hypothetical protein SDRG_04941 [Saprolegnia diclina VS20]|uniref:Uncharacterized protein n=1 Tax=Saprolegnia diclina (strain VS20) TaxID=1156394 RepID=T0QIW2_SAPDV|nr:hypothetical protein SDRG_04941 [Saprolegnia diclina VS20]EQC37924.1 hypothetical protein SDRG_04941 [Saprolegnia diclina VS20]|eukprot:XP_008608857.1 hypothetical protein SDRG_04941 [Saprolegnia diclina VS20]